jgi:excisionase family DNA binding protein
MCASQAVTEVTQISARMLSIKAAAAYLGTSVWFIRTLIWERKVPHVRAGHRFLLDRGDLDRFVDAEKISGPIAIFVKPAETTKPTSKLERTQAAMRQRKAAKP